MRILLLTMVCAAAGLHLTSAAFAAEDDGWYIGANVGAAQARIEEQRIRNGLLSSGFAVTAYDDHESHLGYKPFGGYQLGRYFALEAGMFDPSHFSFDVVTSPSGTLLGEIDLLGGFIDAIGIVPLGGNFAAFGRLGASRVRAIERYTGSGAVNVLSDERHETATNFKFGGGLQYRISDHVAARLEAERYRADDASGNRGDVDIFSIGMTYRWRTPQSTPVAMPPAPMRLAAPTGK